MTPTAEAFFRVTNTVALLAWIALLLAPGRRLVSGVVCATVVPGLLAAAYGLVIVAKLALGGPPPGDLTTLAGLRGAFADDWVLAAAWTHYLVFDMVVGAWVARDAVRRGIPWPLRTLALGLTFLLGPIGFLLHLVVRLAAGHGLAVGTETGTVTAGWLRRSRSIHAPRGRRRCAPPAPRWP